MPSSNVAACVQDVSSIWSGRLVKGNGQYELDDSTGFKSVDEFRDGSLALTASGIEDEERIDAFRGPGFPVHFLSGICWD
jgi:hypothetical protein